MTWDSIMPFIGPISWLLGFLLWLHLSHQTHRTRKILIRELGEALLITEIYKKLIADEKKDNECPK